MKPNYTSINATTMILDEEIGIKIDYKKLINELSS